MRRALLSLLVLGACGQPHSGSTDGPPGGGDDDDGSMPGDDADVPCDCLDATSAIDGPPGADGAVDSPADTGGSPDSPVVDPPCPTWCSETPPANTAAKLFAVYAVSATDAFAVGDTGTIIRRTGAGWVKLTSGTTANLRGVWAASGSDAWAVGEGGTILRWNGTAWTAITGVTTSDVNAVWGAGANDVWLAGTSKMHHWNGSTWTSTTVPGSLQGLSGTGGTDIWLATEGSYAKHYTGTNWATVMPTGGSSTVFAVLDLGASDVWSSSGPPGTEMLHWTGAAWSGTSTSGAIFTSLYGTGAADVWGVGGSRVGHWTGSSWTVATPTGITMSLWGVHGSGSDVYVVGSGPTILHHN